jgi:hypothetical protein
MQIVRTLAWLACVVYSTVPLFWFMVHPRAAKWREQRRSPFRVLLPAWLTMWVGVGVITGPWRNVQFYSTPGLGVQPPCYSHQAPFYIRVLGRNSAGRSSEACRKCATDIVRTG